MNLPIFKYHPDPIATKCVEASTTQCLCCEQARGFIYTGPVFAEEELNESICPWCIADGSAHEKFEAEFTDFAGVGSDDDRMPLPDRIIEEVSWRTPGFSGWQQEKWLACCGDASAFLGRAGADELTSKWPEAIPALMKEAGLTAKQWERYFKRLDAEESPTAYVFRCLHCAKLSGYSDSD
ncbi:MAG: CbrC family protein [Opitutus sp.]